MANRTGAKWNRGGSNRRNHGMNIDFSCFEIYAEELENLGADMPKIFQGIMEDVGEEVQGNCNLQMNNYISIISLLARQSRMRTSSSCVKDSTPLVIMRSAA